MQPGIVVDDRTDRVLLAVALVAPVAARSSSPPEAVLSAGAPLPGADGSQGDLRLAGSAGRFNASIHNSGATGAIEIPVDLAALPQPTGPIAAMVGDSWNFQAWLRDANPTVTSNLSDGVEVTLR